VKAAYLNFSPATPAIRRKEVRENTGFELPFHGGEVFETKPPTPAELSLLRGTVRNEIAGIYPSFAEKAFGSLKNVKKAECH
jgi:hypothetical protein